MWLNKPLKIVETYGFDYGMKFNPDKTMYMVNNDKIQMKSSNKLEDIFQSEPSLDGVQKARVQSMRYLGVIVNKNGKVEAHIKTRIQNMHRSVAKLLNSGLFSDRMIK